MNFKQTTIILLSLLALSCNKKKKSNSEEKEFQNKGHQLVHQVVNKAGTYQDLLDRNDVIYTYTYKTSDGKTDISTEKYIFKGELSYGLYEHHERTFPDLKGQIEQGYDGNKFWLKHNGERINEEDRLEKVAFNRPTNFYWFAMFQKLLDPGLDYEYLGDKIINEKEYDVVKITFNSTKKKPTDTYQIYINKKTLLVDQFLFTVADYGVLETPYLMKLNYQEVDKISIPAKRKYKKSTWDADINDKPWTEVTWSNIKFNNNLSKEDFKP